MDTSEVGAGIAGNGSVLAEVGDLEHRSVNLPQKHHRSRNVEVSKSAPILASTCYQQPFFRSKLKFKTMIQGKEIRIGNYLKDRGGKVLRVDFIEYVENGFDTKFGQKMFVEGEEVHPITEYSNYAEPVDLSIEWLEKLGFQNVSNLYFYHSDFCCKIEKLSNRWAVRFVVAPKESITITYINYVHQLQNLFYVFKNEELSVSI